MSVQLTVLYLHSIFHHIFIFKTQKMQVFIFENIFKQSTAPVWQNVINFVKKNQFVQDLHYDFNEKNLSRYSMSPCDWR